MINKIVSIKQNSKYEWAIKKSKFIAYSFIVSSEEICKEKLKELKEIHSDATHICYAYSINYSTEKCNDNGEPQGTAGKPILDCIKKSGITNVLIAVVRYFGGIKLGAGGLLRSYSDSASGVILQSEKATLLPYDKIEFTVNYAENKLIENIRNLEYVKEYKITFLDNVIIGLFVQVEYKNKLIQYLNNALNKSVDIFTKQSNIFM